MDAENAWMENAGLENSELENIAPCRVFQSRVFSRLILSTFSFYSVGIELYCVFLISFLAFFPLFLLLFLRSGSVWSDANKMRSFIVTAVISRDWLECDWHEVKNIFISLYNCSNKSPRTLTKLINFIYSLLVS